MEPKMFCQSCTMPIDNTEDRGTEKDGAKSKEYCKYCYQNGEFTNPDLKYEQMKATINAQMKQMNMPPDVLKKSLDLLPHLKRWKRA